MKAKKVYEFKRTRKQGLSDKTEIGIVTYTRREIEKWFEENTEDVSYEINDDLSVIVYSDLYLDDINEIPFNNLTIHDRLVIMDSNISKLPDYLKVGGSLSIRSTNITELPETLFIKNKNKTVYDGNLVLTNNYITNLPDDLYVGGYLDLSYNKELEELPKQLKIQGGSLYIDNTSVSYLPETIFERSGSRLEISGDLFLSYTNITELPDNLTIYGTLNLGGTELKYLPDNLTVVGDIYLNKYLNEMDFPETFELGGKIYTDD